MSNILTQKIGMRGEFDIATVACDDEGTPIGPMQFHLKDCKNLITNGGMNHMATGGFNTFTSAVQVGTGNTAPAYGNSSLATFLAGKHADDTYSGSRFSWSGSTLVLTRVYTFAVGAAAGVLAELGLSSSSSGGTLMTRALFRDNEGNPVTVTVMPNEQLIVTYRVLITVNSTDSVLVTTQKGVEYTVTLRPSEIGSAAGDLSNNTPFCAMSSHSGTRVFHGASSEIGDSSTSPSGASGTANAALSRGSYTADSFHRTDVMTIPLDQGNYTDIGVIHMVAAPFRYKAGISPRFSKTANDTVNLTVRTVWSRD